MDFEPIWIKHIRDPKVKTILITGCGGGFDFTHSLLFIPTIISFKKNFVVISNSFTNINEKSDHPIVYDSKTTPKYIAREIRPGETSYRGYFPEIHFVNFLKEKYATKCNWTVYGSNANEGDYRTNIEFYTSIVSKHSIDMIITIDGGSDSIMKGDEYGIATVYEDWLSLIAIHDVAEKFNQSILFTDLLTVGVGVDRFHGASDASSLRAVAELTRMGGFLGNCSIMPCSEGLEIYSDFIKYHNSKSDASSIIQSMVLASAVGQYGPGLVDKVKPVSRDIVWMPKSAVELLNLTKNGNNFASCGNKRTNPKTTYIWPIMSNIYGFDIKVVLKRCPDAFSLKDEKKFQKFYDKRKKIPIENFPRQEEMCPYK